MGKSKEKTAKTQDGGPADKVASSKPSHPDDGKQVTNQPSRWYGGSWKGKAVAVSGVARETRPPSTDADVDTTTTVQKKASKSLLTPKKSSPIAASMTKLNISSNGPTDSEPQGQESTVPEHNSTASTAAPETAGEQSAQERPAPLSGWGGWWTRGEKAAITIDAPEEQSKQDVVNPSHSKQKPSRSSWFGLWGEEPLSSTSRPRTKSLPAEPEVSQATEPVKDDASKQDTPNKVVTVTPERQTSGSWAFWSRESPLPPVTTRDAAGTTSVNESGEVAVENTPSQSNPQPAKMTRTVEDPTTSKKRGRPISSDTVKITAKRKATVGKAEPTGEEVAQAFRTSETTDMASSILRTTIEKPAVKSTEPSEKRQNLVLPELRDVYCTPETPSYWQQLTRVFGRGQGNTHQLSIAPAPFKPKRALAIGVHGFFPAALIQKVLGPPTGTSIRFASQAASAIERWCYSHSIDCSIEKVALEGEGMILSRVDALWKLLLNWVETLRSADLILFAAHSQGVPVTVMLVERLLQFGCLKSDARIGICAMAGVNMGPFASYQTRILGAVANELFAFSRPDSDVSKRYLAALNHCLASHVRVLYIGSIDDQLVPIDSATFVPITHPYIFRAVFVDGRLHAPDFLTRLVGFVLKLRNLGVSDHGLLKELSSPLAGSLYTGEGHSRIYEDDGVYDLALEVTLETNGLTISPSLDSKTLASLVSTSTTQVNASDSSSTASTSSSNPFFLPWAMRGVLEEDYVRTALREEMTDLLNLFDSWRPTSKVLKDVRFRLEAVKSKL